MTFVVARLNGSQIALAADTLLTEHEVPLPPSRGTIKLCLLPGNLCVGFSNSPELAQKTFSKYISQYPEGAGFLDAITFFENEGKNTGNDYLIAFGNQPKIVKIANGSRVNSISRTAWIGDKSAYIKFREIELLKHKSHYRGRAVDAVLFGDEVSGSEAGNLYPTMRELVRDRTVSSVGGFVTTASTRGAGFRFSIYSDTLFDWPVDQAPEYDFDINHKIALGSSGENQEYVVAQISSAYMGANFVGYYLLHGKKLFFYFGINNGLASNCFVASGVEPHDVANVITKNIGLDLGWLVWVISSHGGDNSRTYQGNTESPDGVQIHLFCHANTCPVDQTRSGLLRVGPTEKVY